MNCVEHLQVDCLREQSTPAQRQLFVVKIGGTGEGLVTIVLVRVLPVHGLAVLAAINYRLAHRVTCFAAQCLSFHANF